MSFIQEHHFKAQITTYDHWDTVATSWFCELLVHFFILRWWRKIHMRSNGSRLMVLIFDSSHISLPLWLVYVSTDDLIFISILLVIDHMVWKTYFAKETSITYIDIMHVFEQEPWGEDEFDAIKLVLLYNLHFGLLEIDNKKVIPK